MDRRLVLGFALTVGLLTTVGASTLSAQAEGVYRGTLEVVKFDISPPLRSLPVGQASEKGWGALMNDPGPIPEQAPGTDAPDPVVQDWVGWTEIPSPIVSFNGQPNLFGGSPPDPVGDIGPNHYVAMSNLHFQIFDRLGNSLFGPAANNTLWAGFGGPCQNENSGDPIVLYDQLADRWLLTQFTSAGPTYFNCIALSQTPDPTGAYFRWAVSTGTNFPDYPKYGVWPDAYYISTREFPAAGAERPGAYAMNRAQMIAGNPAPTIIAFVIVPGTTPAFNYGNGLLPSDLDGSNPPPAGSPNYYIGTMDDGGGLGAPGDAMTIWEFHADFVTPANSTFTLAATVPFSSYDTIFGPCGGTRACIPQPGTANRLDILAYRQRPLHRAAYRNFGSHESIVTNQSVEAGANSGIAGIRWWELRDPGGVPTIFQEGTYAPGLADGIHRWMGSIAMDSAGNMALGYSASDDNSPAPTGTFPSSWYTGRLASDPLGTMPQGEGSIINGTGSQTGSNRWGDYTSMNVDPLDDCTFWYVNEWVPVTSGTGWRLRIGAFRFNECGSPDFFLSPTPAAQTVCVGTNAVYTVNVGSIAGFSNNVTLSAAGNPAPTTTGFAPNPVTPPGASTFTIGNTAGAAPGIYTVTITGTATGAGPHSADVDLELINTAPAAPTLVSPPNGASGVSTSPLLTWNAAAGADDYFVEVDDNADFSSPEFTDTVAGTSTTASGLATDTLYNWRVFANNACGGTASSVFTFTTGVLFCAGPITIPDSGTATPYPSTVSVSMPGNEILSLTLEINGLTHTFPDDLDLLLVGPGGQTLVVMSDVGGSGDVSGLNLTLDDAAAAILPDAGPLVAGSFRPSNVTGGDAFAAPAPAGPHNNPAPAGTATFGSIFGGTDPNGDWSLYLVDDAGGDQGSLANWCVVPTVAVIDPQIELNPTSVASTQGMDQVVVVPLDVNNVGTGDLDWQIEEEPVPIAPKSYPTRAMAEVAGLGDPRFAAESAADDATGEGTVPAVVEGPTWEVPQAVLYDNGPLVTHPGGGAGGADASALQTALGLNIFGFGHQVSAGNRVADDFTVTDPAGWNVDTITFFAYQTGSTTTSTMNAVNLRIWDGPPNVPASTVIFGDTTTNRLLTSSWTNMYRVTDTAMTGTTRPVMANVVTVGITLAPGTYWLDWQTGGTLASGPWAPPISILGQTTTGNALQWTGAWAPAIDTGPANAPQGFPFVIEGTLALCGAPADVPWLAVDPLSGTTPGGGTSAVDVTLDSTGLTPGDYFATLCVTSNDADDPLVAVPVALTVDSMPFLDGFETSDTSRWSLTVP